MTSEKLQELIKAAQSGDTDSREELIRRLRGWVESVVARLNWRDAGGPDEDALSVALMALNEAVDGYKPGKKSFKSYAYMVIRNRLRDHARSQKRHRHLSLEQAGQPQDTEESETAHPGEVQRAWEHHHEREAARERARELDEYRCTLQEFGVDLTELPQKSPQHRDSRRTLLAVAQVLADNEELCSAFLRKRQVPLSQLTETVTVSRKTIKRWRPFIVAAALVFATPEWEKLNEFFHYRKELDPKAVTAVKENGESVQT